MTVNSKAKYQNLPGCGTSEEDLLPFHVLVIYNLTIQVMGIKYTNTHEHTTAGRSGIKPGNPLSISPLVPRKTKFMLGKQKNYS